MASPDERHADDRLAALFAAELPPARDTGFQAEVLEALARRRFLIDLAWLSAACGVGAAVMWAIWPAVAPALVTLGQGLAPGATAVVIAASIAVVASGRSLLPRT